MSTDGSLGVPGGAQKAWIEALELFSSRMNRAADIAVSANRQAAVADLRLYLPHLTAAMLGRLAELGHAESD